MSVRLLGLPLAASFIALMGTACIPDLGGDDDSDSDGPGGHDDSVGDDDTGGGGEDSVQCHISGKVTVQLYTYDAEGELQYLSFEDAYGGTFPFGAVWVTTYREDGSGGVANYTGADTFLNPSITGDDFDIDVNLAAAGDIRLFGQLDYWSDGILGSSEPTGIHPDTVSCTDGADYTDVDITILAPYYDFDGGGGGGGPGCSTVNVSGDVLITTAYAGGRAAAMLLDANGNGPYRYTFTDPSASGGGAEGPYAMATCANEGTAKLVGAWDKDGNQLIDPADKWGAYISSPDVDGNPISIGTTNLSAHDIQIPLGDGGTPWGIVPFVSLSGTVSVDGGVFDDLPAGTSVYVAALKYRPNGDISVSDLSGAAYDIESWSWASLAGESSQSWSLNVPANTIVYLWAYADTDSDGVVNESGEHVASGGSNNVGRLPTGTNSTSGYSLGLGTPGI